MRSAFRACGGGSAAAAFSGPVIPSAVDAPAFYFDCGEAEHNLDKHIGSLRLPLNRLSRSISLSLNHTELSPSLGLRTATFYKLLTR
jgi:hypothetical protein